MGEEEALPDVGQLRTDASVWVEALTFGLTFRFVSFVVVCVWL